MKRVLTSSNSNKNRKIELSDSIDYTYIKLSWDAQLNLDLKNGDTKAICSTILEGYLANIVLDADLIQQAVNLGDKDVVLAIVEYFINIKNLFSHIQPLNDLLELAKQADEFCQGRAIRKIDFNNLFIKIFIERVDLNLIENNEVCNFKEFSNYHEQLPPKLIEKIQEILKSFDSEDDLSISEIDSANIYSKEEPHYHSYGIHSNLTAGAKEYAEELINQRIYEKEIRIKNLDLSDKKSKTSIDSLTFTSAKGLDNSIIDENSENFIFKSQNLDTDLGKFVGATYYFD